MADKYNVNRLAFRHARIANGLCRDCGKSPYLPEKVVCEPCMRARTLRQSNYKKKRNENQLCRKCGGDLELNRLTSSLCQKCAAAQIERARQVRRRNKERVLNYFGGKCCHCEINDFRVLTLDHVNGGGNLDRKGVRTYAPSWYAKLYLLIIKNKFDLLPKLQILCYNCHAIKDLCPWWLK